MSPILESIGSVKGFGWGAFLVPNSFESIATTTVGSGGSTSITFSSIPSIYTHLQLRCFVLSNTAAGSSTLTINGAGGKSHWLSANGTTPSSAFETNTMFLPLVQGRASSGSAVIADFFDYKNTNKNKTIRTLAGYDASGTGYVNLTSNLWVSTNAITSISIASVGTFNQYSSFALYGIKG